MVYQTLSSTTKDTARAILAARKRNVEIMGKTSSKVAVLSCAVDSMVGHFSYSTSNKRLRAHFSILVRDKDTDIAWLYGPWKVSVSFGPSAYQLRPGQSTCIPSSTRVQEPRHNRLGTGVHQGILLAPDPLLSCRLTQRKVWFNPQVPQICKQRAHHHRNSSGRIESVSGRKYNGVSICRRISAGRQFSATKCTTRTASGRKKIFMISTCCSKPKNKDVLCCRYHLRL